MTGNLILNRNSASCTSSWTGQQATAVEVVYTAPTWDYDNVTITVPAEMAGATFNSVTITYTVSDGGTKSIKYSDTREGVSNTTLLERLRGGDREIVLLFLYKATGGSGGLGPHSSTCRWRDISIEVEYIPAADISGTVSFSGCQVFYAMQQNSVLLNESGTAILSVTPDSACTSVQLEMRPHGQTSDVLSYSWGVAAPAGRQTTIQPDYMVSGITLASRVVAADIRITLETAAGTRQSQWVATELKLVSSRAAPVVTVALSDAGQSALPVYVQSKSKIKAVLTVTLDTAADSHIAVKSRRLTIGGSVYTSGDNTFLIDTAELSGSKAWTVTVADSYGVTGTASGTVDIKPYFTPALSVLEITRYVIKTDSEGHSFPVESDDGSAVWVTAQGGAAPCGGENGWTLTAVYSGTTRVMATGKSAEGTFSFTKDCDKLRGAVFSPTAAHTITVTLADAFGSASYAVIIPKAGGIFSVEPHGVAVGKRATGTAAKPKFEVAYEAYFENGIFDKDGVSIAGQTYSGTEACVGQFMGRKLYRKVIFQNSISTSSGLPSVIPTGLGDVSVTRIDGVVHTDSYGDLPANCFHSGDIKAFCRYDRGSKSLVAYASAANSGAYYIVEYTGDTEGR